MGRGRLPAGTGNRGRDSRKGTRQAADKKKQERESSVAAYARKKAGAERRVASLVSHAQDFGWEVASKTEYKDALGRLRKVNYLFTRGGERVNLIMSTQTGTISNAVYMNPYDHDSVGTKDKNAKVRWWLSGPRKYG